MCGAPRFLWPGGISVPLLFKGDDFGKTDVAIAAY
jgi:uncharacterized protein with PIN domain